MRSGLPFKVRARRQIVGSGGFTITESLIFLAVSSALLISALGLFNGSQNRTQFAQAMDDANQQINTVINNVANGYYPRTKQITCTPTGGIAPVQVVDVSAADAEAGRGAQKNCMFIGLAVQFRKTDEKFRIFSIVGARQADNALGEPREVENFVEAKPAPIESFEEIRLKNGIEIATLRIKGTSADRGIIGFFTGFGRYDPGDVQKSKLLSGALATDYVLFPSSSLTASSGASANVADMVSGLATLTSTPTAYSAAKNPPEGVEVCFESGNTDQHGVILIGGLNATTATTMTINNGKCPV